MAWFFEVFVLGCDRKLWECAEPLQALKSASRELLSSRVGNLLTFLVYSKPCLTYIYSYIHTYIHTYIHRYIDT